MQHKRSLLDALHVICRANPDPEPRSPCFLETAN
jgi:hypothetical protein